MTRQMKKKCKKRTRIRSKNVCIKSLFKKHNIDTGRNIKTLIY